MQLAPYAQRWLDSRNDEITTRARDASIMRTHVVTRWGTWPLGTIDHTGVQQWVSDLAAQLSPATVAEAHRLLSAVLRAAVRDRLLAVDPCEGIKVPAAANATPPTRSSTATPSVTTCFPRSRTVTARWSPPPPVPACGGANSPGCVTTPSTPSVGPSG